MTENADAPKSNDMNVDTFLEQLPELFAKSNGKRISEDPQYAELLKNNPTAAELVRDLEYIAEQARMLLEPEHEIEPSEDVWSKIQSSLKVNPETAN